VWPWTQQFQIVPYKSVNALALLVGTRFAYGPCQTNRYDPTAIRIGLGGVHMWSDADDSLRAQPPFTALK
jgi:hypothetical protein